MQLIKNKFLLYLITSLCVFSTIVRAQEHQLTIGSFEIEGKILSDPYDLPAYCGYIAYAVVFEIYVTKSSNPLYYHKVVPVVIYCPRSYETPFLSKTLPFFNKESIFKMNLSPGLNTELGWAIHNNYLIDKYNDGPFSASGIKKLE